MMLTDLAAGRIAMQFGMTGPNFAVMSACASSANAIGEGAEIIKRGNRDLHRGDAENAEIRKW
jgi:3-oxoacyl-[acyl-carrier-protein] synthase II